ncbi:MAG: hypothetical protein ACYTBJ_10500, partial [Planctomycetota bacterium]
MEVDPIGHKGVDTLKWSATTEIDQMEQTQELAPHAGPVTQDQDLTADQTQEGERKGVIRLLQEGHFKGVADVRLRINFFDELSAINKAQVEAVARDKTAAVVQAVRTAVDSFITDNELTTDDAAAVRQAHDTFLQAAGQSQQDPVPMLKNVFETFIEGLQNMVASPAAEEETQAGEGTGEEPDVGNDPGSQPTPADNESPDWQGFIENLRAAFSAALQDL